MVFTSAALNHQAASQLIDNLRILHPAVFGSAKQPLLCKLSFCLLFGSTSFGSEHCLKHWHICKQYARVKKQWLVKICCPALGFGHYEVAFRYVHTSLHCNAVQWKPLLTQRSSNATAVKFILTRLQYCMQWHQKWSIIGNALQCSEVWMDLKGPKKRNKPKDRWISINVTSFVREGGGTKCHLR